MFESTKYSWATSQIETVIAFDLRGNDFMINWCRDFFLQEDFRKAVVSFTKETGSSVYDAIGHLMMECLKLPYDEENRLDTAASKFSKKCYLIVLAATQIKQNGISIDDAVGLIRDGHIKYGLGELQV